MKELFLYPWTLFRSHTTIPGTGMCICVQASHGVCGSSHSMTSVVGILISHESQSCCSFNKLPLLPLSHCFHRYTHSKRNTVKCAAGLFKIGENKKCTENINKNILLCCTNAAKTPPHPPTPQNWLMRISGKLICKRNRTPACNTENDILKLTMSETQCLNGNEFSDFYFFLSMQLLFSDFYL